MSRPSCIFSDKKQLRSRDTRIGLLALCALILCGVLSYKINEKYWLSVAARPAPQLVSAGGELIFDKTGLPLGKKKGDLRELTPCLTPFFFQPIPVNFADAELIETIDGIGPHLANEIIRTRNTRGFFNKSDDLLNVPGIGQKRIRQLEKQFSFETNL